MLSKTPFVCAFPVVIFECLMLAITKFAFFQERYK